MLVVAYIAICLVIKLVRKVTTIDVGIMSRRQGKSLMASTLKLLRFKMLTDAKKQKFLLKNYGILFDDLHAAAEIRDKILNEEERFVRILDGTEGDFLIEQYKLLEEMTRNRQ